MQAIDNADGFFTILGPLNAKQLKKKASITLGDPAQAKVERAELNFARAEARLAKAKDE